MNSERLVRKRSLPARVVRRLPVLTWLTLVWVLLWGKFDIGTLFFGVVVALIVSIVFPMPPIITHIVVRPVRMLQLAAYLAWDLVISTLRVSWQAIRYRGGTTAGIVAVTMTNDSDHLIAMVANGVSLAPGKFVMQIDRANRICYVYALGIAESDKETVHRDVLTLERRVVYAAGSRVEVTAVEERWNERIPSTTGEV